MKKKGIIASFLTQGISQNIAEINSFVPSGDPSITGVSRTWW